MSESPSVNPTSPAPQPAASGGTSFRRLALITLGLIAVAGAVYGIVLYQNPTETLNTSSLLDEYLRHQDKYAKLSDRYTDADGDLLADPPAEASARINPDTIVFSVVGSDDPIEAEARWGGLMKRISDATGKKVIYLKGEETVEDAEPADGEGEKKDSEKNEVKKTVPVPISLDGQVDSLKSGQLHITAFNTGLVSRAVNDAGFVPLFCPADAEGHYGYTMEVIVPADSAIKDIADIRGKTVRFTAMSSNSGAKAPLVIFKEQGLLPGKDYQYLPTGDHILSILGVCYGSNALLRMDPEDKKLKLVVPEKPGPKYDVACVASDLLTREVAADRVKKDQYRSIYTSKEFPPLCFGVPYNLDPALRTKIEEAFQSYEFPGTNPVQKKFARCDYKKDWEYVREIDAKLTNLMK